MKPYPEILITGFPNSGTSFLCNLVVALGKSPGNQRDLKDADKHNRYGYFENMKMRNLAHEILGHEYFKFWDKEFIPLHPLEFPKEKIDKYSKLIAKIAQEGNIEVCKDTIFPIIFKVFPKESKYIVIKRDTVKCYESPQKGGHSKIPCSFEEFLEAYNKYYGLVSQMAKEVSVLQVNYEDFYADFNRSVQKVSEFIGVALSAERLNDLKKIFKPRQSLLKKILSYI